LGRELPNLVRSELEKRIEQALSPIGEVLREQIISIIRDSQGRLFETYRSLRTSAAQAERPEGDNAAELGDQAGSEPNQVNLEILHDALEPYRQEPDVNEDFALFDGEFLLEVGQSINDELLEGIQAEFDQHWTDSGYGSLRTASKGSVSFLPEDR